MGSTLSLSYTDTNLVSPPSLALTKNGANPPSSDQIDKTAKDFESMFISQMMEQMFGDSEGSEAFGSSDSDNIYKGLMMDEYGKQITKAGGIGIADYIKQDLKNELLKLQEK